MGIKYEKAPDLDIFVNEISQSQFPHIIIDSVSCIRSFGSSANRTIARCHALGKAMQLGMGTKGFYVIEVISENFDNLSREEKIKTIIHELMHIPKTFGGGFRFHDYVCEKNIQIVYEKYLNLKKENEI